MEQTIIYREIIESDREWLNTLMTEEWGSPMVVSKGKVHDTAELPGIIAELDGKPAGVLTYVIDGSDCELVTLNSFVEGKGVGTGLLTELKKLASEEGCRRIWMITTNDNTDALKFYQKKGFTFRALYPNALEESRKLKPEIPLTGNDGIPLRDEIELELSL